MTDGPTIDLSQEALLRYLASSPAQTMTASAAEPPAKGLPAGWWAAIIAAQLADALTTNAGIKRGAIEANPMMRGLAEHPTAMVLGKLGMGTALAGLTHLAHKRRPTTGKVLAGALTAVPAIVAAHNMRQE